MAGLSAIGPVSGPYPRQDALPPGAFGGNSSPSPESEAGVLEKAQEQSRGIQGTEELSDEESREVRELKQRDAEVRRHEQAHIAAAGQYARGGAKFEYQRGPDGRQYASGGEVSIDVGRESTPEATLRKAQIVRRAALAPAEPSPQDRSIAAQASRLETEARREIAEAEPGDDPSKRPGRPSADDAFGGIRAGGGPIGPQAFDVTV